MDPLRQVRRLPADGARALLVLSDVQATRPEGEGHKEMTGPLWQSTRWGAGAQHCQDGRAVGAARGLRDNWEPRPRPSWCPVPAGTLPRVTGPFRGKGRRDRGRHPVTSPVGRGRPWLRLAFRPAGWPWQAEGTLELPAQVSPAPAPGSAPHLLPSPGRLSRCSSIGEA